MHPAPLSALAKKCDKLKLANTAILAFWFFVLLIPLSLPGIRVQPIRTIDAWHHVNEVFLDEVRVPVANRLGDEGGGWKCAKFLLDRERLAPAIAQTPRRCAHRPAAVGAGSSPASRPDRSGWTP